MHHGDLTMTTLKTTPLHHPFAGLRIALTGGTSGLGLALLRALRERGAQVAFIARDAERIARIAAAIPAAAASPATSPTSTRRTAWRCSWPVPSVASTC
jgi:NAD(P)-dependent dehydrogenase (short-subunit alcohol dehydrogenase family)